MATSESKTAPAPSRWRGLAAGLSLIVGYFMLFCAILMLLVGGWRSYREHRVDSRWIATTADIEKCSLHVYHPFSRNGGGTVYALHCRLEYEFRGRQYEYNLRTTSDRSAQIRDGIDDWVAHHPRGSTLVIKVNPTNPNEVAARSELPIHQFNTAREAWITALGFGGGGLVLAMIGRQLRFR